MDSILTKQQKLERTKRNLEKLRKQRGGGTPTQSAVQSARASIAGSPTRSAFDGLLFSPTGSERSSFSYVSRHGAEDEAASPAYFGAGSVDSLRSSGSPKTSPNRSDATATISKLTAENEALLSRIATLESIMADPQHNGEAANAMPSSHELDQLRGLLKDAEDRATYAVNQCQQLEAALQQRDQQITELTEKINDVGSRQVVEEQPSDLKIDYESVCKQLAEETAKTLDLQAANAELHRQLVEATSTKGPAAVAEGWDVDVPIDADARAEVDKLSTELDSLKIQNAELVTRIEQLQSSSTASQSVEPAVNHEELQQQITQLQQQLDLQTRQVDEQARRADQLQQENTELQATNDQFTQSVAQLEAQSASSSSDLQTLRDGHAKLVEENELLKRQYTELREKARRHVDELNARGQAVVRERAQLQSQLEVMKKELTALQDRHAQELEQIRFQSERVLSETTEKYEATLATIRSDLESSTSEKERLASELADVRGTLQQSHDRLREDMATLVDSMRDLTEQNGDLKKQLTDLSSEKEALVGQRDTLQEQLAQSQQKLDESSREIELMTSQSADKLADHETMVGELRQQVDDKERAIGSLQQELDDTRAQMEELEARFESLRVRANEEIANRESRLAELGQELADQASSFEEERVSFQAALSESNTRLQSAQTEREALEERIREKDERITQLQEEHTQHLTTLSTGHDDAQRQLLQVQDHATALEHQIDELREQLRLATEGTSTLQNEVETLRAQKDALVAKLQQVAAEKDAVAGEVQEVRAALADAESAIEAVSEEKELIENAMAEADRVLRSHIAELNARLEDSLTGSREEVEESREQLRQVEEALGQMKESLRVAEEEKKQVSDRLVGLEDQLAKAQEEEVSLKDANEKLRLANEDLEHHASDLSSKLAGMQDELDAGKREILDRYQLVASEKDVLQQEYDRLVEDLEETNNLHATELDELHAATSEVAARLAQVGAEKVELERERDVLSVRVAELETRLVTESSHVEEILNATRSERDAALAAEAELRASVRTYETEIQTLHQEIEDSQRDIHASNDSLAERDARLQELDAERSSLWRENEELRENVESISHERDTAVTNLDRALSENNDTRHELQQCQGRVEEVLSQLSALEEGRIALQATIHDLEQQQQDAQTTISHLTAEKEAALKASDALRTQISSLESALQSARDDYESQIQEKHASSADLISSVEREKQSAEDRLRSTHDELERVKRELEGKVHEISVIQDERTALESKLGELNAALEAQRAAAAEEKEAFAETMRDMEEDTAGQVEDLVTTLKEVAAERDILRTRAEGAERALVQKEEELAKLAEDMNHMGSELEHSRRSVEDIQIERDGLVRRLEESELMLEKVRGDANALATELDAVITTRAALEIRVKDLEGVEISLRDRLDEAVELSSAREAEIQKLRGQVEERERGDTDRVRQVDQELERVKAALERESIECAGARAEVEDLTASLKRARDATRDTAVQVETLQLRIREEQERSSQLAIEVADARLKLEEKERALEAVRSGSMSQSVDQSDDARRRLSALESERESLVVRVREDARVIDELNMRVGALEGNIHSLNGALTEADTERIRLEQSLRAADDEIAQLRHEAQLYQRSHAGGSEVNGEGGHEAKLRAVEEKSRHYAQLYDSVVKDLDGYRNELSSNRQRLQQAEEELSALKADAARNKDKDRRRSTAKYTTASYEADDEGGGQRRRRREGRRESRPDRFLNTQDNQGQDGYYLSQAEYFDLQDRAAQVGDYRVQFENAQDLLVEHEREIVVLKEAIQAMTNDSLVRAQRGDHVVLQRNLEELQRAWSHELAANDQLRALLVKTQADAVRGQDEAGRDIAQLRAEMDEVVQLLGAATQDADHSRAEAEQNREQAAELARRAREIERSCNEQLFEYQETLAQQEDLHGREREALESLVHKLESERDKLLRDFGTVKRKLEEKMVEIAKRADDAEYRLEETRRSLRTAEADAARFRNEALGRVNEEAELERRGLIAERNRLEAALFDAKTAARAAKEREADLVARERTAVERLDRERALAADELRAAVAAEQRRAREHIASKASEARHSQELALKEALEERNVLVRQVAEAEERERHLLAEIAAFESKVNRRDPNFLHGDEANRRMQELEKDIQSSVDTIRDLQVQLVKMEEARNAAEAQAKSERERAKKIAFKYEQSTAAGGSRRSSETRISGQESGFGDEVERLRKELWRARKSTTQVVNVVRQTLERTVGGVEMRADEPDMFRLKDQCRNLIAQFLELRALVDRHSVWRADLKFQKLYLQNFGVSPESHSAKMSAQPPSPRSKLRRCIFTVIAIHHMMAMSRRSLAARRDTSRIFIDEDREDIFTPGTTTSRETNGHYDSEPRWNGPAPTARRYDDPLLPPASFTSTYDDRQSRSTYVGGSEEEYRHYAASPLLVGSVGGSGRPPLYEVGQRPGKDYGGIVRRVPAEGGDQLGRGWGGGYGGKERGGVGPGVGREFGGERFGRHDEDVGGRR
ncbi:hypothetical protein HDV00_010875 [Rhizophlyctis rosea]|nr:hypothetical protein HDV00_010875 [Rhizophlyctis rosea]